MMFTVTEKAYSHPDGWKKICDRRISILQLESYVVAAPASPQDGSVIVTTKDRYNVAETVEEIDALVAKARAVWNGYEVVNCAVTVTQPEDKLSESIGL